jgi:hypothetical protein
LAVTVSLWELLKEKAPSDLDMNELNKLVDPASLSADDNDFISLFFYRLVQLNFEVCSLLVAQLRKVSLFTMLASHNFTAI